MKGLLKSFEVLITILFVLTAYFMLFGSREISPDFEIVAWKVRGLEALRALDDSNILANYALANNTEKIEGELENLLPIDLNYKVLICNQSCPNLKTNSEKITSVSYFIAGNVTNVEPREVLLYMWREI